MNAADALAPSETAVAEGRFRGYPPLGRALLVAVLAFAVHGIDTADRLRSTTSRPEHHEVYWGLFHASVLEWEGDVDGPLLESAREDARHFEAGYASSGVGGRPGRSSFNSVMTLPILLPTWLVPTLAVLEIGRVWWWRRRRWVSTGARVVGLDGAGRWIGSAPLEPGDVVDERAQALLRRHVPLFGAPADPEDLLAPGEHLAWEGRATGILPLWRRRALGAIALVLVYCGVAAVNLAWTAQKRNLVPGPGNAPAEEKTDWSFGWLKISAVHHTSYTPVTGPWTGGRADSDWPTPIVALPLLAAAELVLLARFRARRYAVTDQRVFALGWRGRWLACLSRREPLEAVVEGSTVAIRGRSGQLRFEGLEDPHAVASAFEATGPVPPPR